MFWADKIAEEAVKKYAILIKQGKPLIIRDEKTASGRVHVGSLRGVMIHGVVSEALNKKGISNKFLFEINDYDPMDGLPVYLDRATFLEHMGKPLCNVPSPDLKAKNYAEYFAQEFIDVIKEQGFTPEFYRSSDVYKSGRYNDAIRIVMDNAQKIREIYKKVSGAERPASWYPLNVICENCGKVGTTKAISWNGKETEYSCGDYVEWAKGCGHKGKISPFDGRAKLPWKVEWAAKFTVFDVQIEGGGKDHSTRGGSREIADAISREVFKREPPLNIPYEFFVVGGKKMSSSKGAGSSAREMADLLPPHMLRFLMIQKEPNRVIDFIPDGDTVPVLYDSYDRYAKNYFQGIKDDFNKAFEYSHLSSDSKKFNTRILPRFSQVAHIVEMPHLDPIKEFEKIEGKQFGQDDIDELSERIKYAKIWLETYAPPDYKFEIQSSIPENAKNLSQIQKDALLKVLEYVKSQKELDGQKLHTVLHDIKTELNISPNEFFGAIYMSILGKESGPKAGWFLSVMDKKFLENRLEEVCSISSPQT